VNEAASPDWRRRFALLWHPIGAVAMVEMANAVAIRLRLSSSLGNLARIAGVSVPG